MTEADILRALTDIAFSDYTEYIWIEDGQVRVKDTRLLTDGQRSAIAGIKDTGKGVELKLVTLPSLDSDDPEDPSYDERRLLRTFLASWFAKCKPVFV